MNKSRMNSSYLREKRRILPKIRIRQRQATAGYNAVNMRMRLQGLSPSVQDAEKSNLGAQVFGIGRHFQ